MKRIGIITVLVLMIALGLALLLPSPTVSRNAPRYVAGRAQPVGNYTATHYDWIDRRPFVDDKVWIWGRRNATNSNHCLYDLQERMILGELHNGGVELVNGDGTKLLIAGFGSQVANLKEKLLDLLERI